MLLGQSKHHQTTTQLPTIAPGTGAHDPTCRCWIRCQREPNQGTRKSSDSFGCFGSCACWNWCPLEMLLGGLQHVTSVEVRNDLTMSWMFLRYGGFSNSITCCLAHRMPQDATGCHRMPHIAELTLFGCSDHLEILEVQLLVWECLGRMFSEEIEFFSKGFGLCHKVHMDYRSILSSL